MTLEKLAAVQMRVADGDGETNRRHAAELLDSAPGADLYLLPELWTSGYDFDSWRPMAENDAAATIAWMREQARARGAWIGGSFINLTDDGALANRMMLFDADGNEVVRYDKCHLFPPLQEPSRMKGGSATPAIPLDGLRVAPAICYDLRFPEMFRRIALRGVDLFLVPSEWPHPRQRAMSVLAEARAIENQAFLLLANRCGPDAAGNRFCGHSGLFGPFGAMVVAGEDECVVTGSIDRDLLEKSRRALAVLSDRVQGIDFD